MSNWDLMESFGGSVPLFFILLLVLSLSCLSTRVEAVQGDGLDEFFKDGLQRPKFRPMPTKCDGVDETVVKLDGVWRINPEPPEGFEKEAREGKGWHDFKVPGQWLQQGFDIPEANTAGVATTFKVPEPWAGRRVILRFDAIHGGTNYYVNGYHIGYSENLFTPVEWDITDAVKVGEANRLVLAMKVETPSETQSFSSAYAKHNLGGIDRSVSLFVVPPVHVSSLHCETRLDKEYKDAELVVDLFIDNTTTLDVSDVSLDMELLDSDGKPVTGARKAVALDGLKAGENRVSVTMPVKDPTKWNAEKPYLYNLRTRLVSGEETLEAVEQTVGFRSIEIKDRQLYINGTLVKILGTGMHQVNPLAGRADTAKYAAEDVRLMKEANLNYIRTCHYPYPHEFLDECDRQGLYVESEAPFCWSAGNNDMSLVKYFMYPTAAMVEFNRNHPSVIIWSVENETPVGACIHETIKFIHAADPTRLVTDQERAGDCQVAGWHYGPFPCDSCPDVYDMPRPTLYDEFMPIMSDHFMEQYDLDPGLDSTWAEGQNSDVSYTSQIHHSPHVIGGALWGLIDDDFVFADRTRKGYGGWGIIDAWRRKKCSFWDCMLMYTPAWIPVREIEWNPEAKSIAIPVENRYSFTNLDELTCTWQVKGQRKSCRLDVPPRTMGAIEIPVQSGMGIGDMVTVSFANADGRVISAQGVRLAGPSREYFTFRGMSKMEKHGVKMDGEFSDWKDVPELTVGDYEEKTGDGREGNDIEHVRMTADEISVYFFIKCVDPIKKLSDWYPTFVVVDADSDASTGYPSKPLGIDYLIQPFGGGRTDVMVHKRLEEANHGGWSGWHEAVIVEDAYQVGTGENSNCVELRIPWKALRIDDPKGASFRFRIEDGAVGLSPESGDWVPNAAGQYAIPMPESGRPGVSDDGKVITVDGDTFALKLDKSTGKFLPVEGKKRVALLELPSPFFSRAEGLRMKSPHVPNGVPYEEYPDFSTRRIESVKIEEREDAVAIIVSETYKDIAGTCELVIDKTGRAMLHYDYEYTGQPITVGEAGVRLLCDKGCREIRWRANAEWDVYPEDHIGRGTGTAKAQRPGSKGESEYPPFLERPSWSWSLDENEHGTRDFRSTKHHIYEAELVADDGSGVRVDSDGTTADVRVCLSPEGVEFHILNGFKPARPLAGGFHMWHLRTVGTGYKHTGAFSIELLTAEGE